MNKDLKDYINNNNITSSFNILINDTKNEWYSKIGQEIINIYGIDNLPLIFSYSVNKLKNKKFTKFNKENDIHREIAIYFLTGYLCDDKLEELFGEPIRHSEFGEGFHEYDDNEEEIEIEEYYRSYFPIINGVKIHIGYDHRGTSIEVPRNMSAVETYDIMILLVKLAYEKEK